MRVEPIQFVAMPWHSAEVRARLAKVSGIALRNAAAITKRRQIQVPDLNKRANTIINAPLPATVRMAALWQLADDMLKAAKGYGACRKGCSHCCHLGVAISPTEAELIGSRIGRKPAPVTGATDFKTFDWGYHNPCSFLNASGECSIYEHRPLVCRMQLNLDNDDLLCRLTPPNSVPVPYSDNTEMHKAEFYVAFGDREGPIRFADIREWFPK